MIRADQMPITADAQTRAALLSLSFVEEVEVEDASDLELCCWCVVPSGDFAQDFDAGVALAEEMRAALRLRPELLEHVIRDMLLDAGFEGVEVGFLMSLALGRS